MRAHAMQGGSRDVQAKCRTHHCAGTGLLSCCRTCLLAYLVAGKQTFSLPIFNIYDRWDHSSQPTVDKALSNNADVHDAAKLVECVYIQKRWC